MTQLYSIVDIETTGSSAANGKITEIAIIVTDGATVYQNFSTLINPECRIPVSIVSLTGITNEMVENAPCFYEVARQIVEITENTVFVAHNVSFDYGFVRSEFQRLGFQFKRDCLCTVKLSRKLLPGLDSYSLGNLCQSLGIVINNRHRALGDALATVELFKLLFSIDNRHHSGKCIQGVALKGLNALLNMAKIKALPEEMGVYYFYNEAGDLIYIGKSNNIHQRVMSHLRNESGTKALSMKQEIADVDYELTGNELVALLKESHEIKMHKPRYNVSRRRSIHQWGIYHYVDEAGYINLCIQKNDSVGEVPLDSYASQTIAKEVLYALCNEFGLCQKLCGLYQSAGACFYYAIGECSGACTGAELPEEYNRRVSKVLERYGVLKNDMLIVLQGRHTDEIATVSVKNGKYMGYGFCDTECIAQPEILCECVKSYPDNRDARQIIRSYLNTGKVLKIIKTENVW